MTQQTPYPPSQATAPRNGLGLTGFVLGLIGLVFSFIPVIGLIAWPLVVLGVIFSGIGLSRVGKRQATNKGVAISGLVLSVIGLAVCIVWAVAFKEAVDDINNEANREVTVVYEVTGDATNVTIDYSTYGDSVSTSQQTAATLPWSKEVKTKGFVKGGALIVTTGDAGGTVNCRVMVDGKEVTTGNASGQFAVADCTGF